MYTYIVIIYYFNTVIRFIAAEVVNSCDDGPTVTEIRFTTGRSFVTTNKLDNDKIVKTYV